MNGYDHPQLENSCFQGTHHGLQNTNGSILQEEIHITEEAFTRACSNLSQAQPEIRSVSPCIAKAGFCDGIIYVYIYTYYVCIYR